MKKKRTETGPILLTGAAGFIGFHVAEALLARGENVVGFDALTPYNDPALKERRLSQLRKNKAFVFVKGSIADSDALSAVMKKYRPRAIIHLAAQAGVRYSLEAPQSYVEANVLGSTNVFELARLNGLPVVYASSSSVYGERPGTFRETDITDAPISIYAATKKATEVLAHSYNSLYATPMIGLRFFTVYGPWIRTDLALFRFARLLLEGNTIPLYAEGKGKRSFTHVSYVVRGTLAALDALLRGKKGHTIYNLGDEHAVVTKDVLYRLAHELGVEAQVLLMPPQKGDVLITKASSAKARRELKLPVAMPLSRGLKEFARWFKSNKAFLMKLEDMHL